MSLYDIILIAKKNKEKTMELEIYQQEQERQQKTLRKKDYRPNKLESKDFIQSDNTPKVELKQHFQIKGESDLG